MDLDAADKIINLPEHDTPPWRELRDQRLAEWIEDEDAIQFIKVFGTICELWDDLIDQDKEITKDFVNDVFTMVFVDLSLNPFFDLYKSELVPIIITGINAWLDANELEAGPHDQRVVAYTLRSWYTEIINFTICRLYGFHRMRELSLEIRQFFLACESLDEYLGKL